MSHASSSADQQQPIVEDAGILARRDVDRVVGQGVEHICDAIEHRTHQLAASNTERGPQVISKTADIVRVFRETRDRIHAAGMYRYLVEGGLNSYSADPKPLIDFLEQEGYLDGPTSGLFDLGSGPGQMVAAWQETGRPARGVDLSPSFVLNNSDLRLGLIDEDYTDLLDALDGDFKPGLVMTSMTLDRVRKPEQLLSNVTNLARQYGAPFSVATILPIQPEDDDPSANVQIIYTDEQNRITTGVDAEQDSREILAILQRLAPDYVIQVNTLPYTIHSSGVTHEYTQYCFCGKPKSEK